MKPFCINENCTNFLPEDKRGYYKKKTEETGEQPAVAEEKKAKKTAAKKPAAKKTAEKKPATKKATKKKGE